MKGSIIKPLFFSLSQACIGCLKVPNLFFSLSQISIRCLRVPNLGASLFCYQDTVVTRARMKGLRVPGLKVPVFCGADLLFLPLTT